MRPPSISATSLAVYKACPARWKVEFFDKAPEVSNDPAGFGQLVHAVLQRWIEEGHYKAAYSAEVVTTLCKEENATRFPDDKYVPEAIGMVKTWIAKQDWTGREVLMTEKKLSFDVPLPDGTKFKFNYIMDRLDRVTNPDGSQYLEVIDYKSVRLPIQPDEIRNRLQARCYALAAKIMYPDISKIIVTFDLLRYEPVGVKFTTDEIKETWFDLVKIATQLLEDDCTAERLNRDCRFCMRRFDCQTLQGHIDGGGPLKISTPEEAAKRRAQLEVASKTIKGMIEEMDGYLLKHCEEDNVLTFTTDEAVIKIGTPRRRSIQLEDVVKVLGSSDDLIDVAKIGIGDVDRLLESPDITDQQKADIRKAIKWNYTKPTVKAELT